MKSFTSFQKSGFAPALPAVLVFTLALMGACSKSTKPNILLITLDTVRADHLGCYHSARSALTPHMDRLAGMGVRFARAVAPAPITLPSHASILTGQHPVRHGVRDNSVYFLTEDAVTLAECLADAGYRTGASVASIALSHRFGVEQGFQVFHEGRLIVEDGQQREGGLIERDGKEVTRETLAYMERQKEGESPFFFWAHYYDPHEPYVEHEGYDSSPATTAYEGEVHYVDREVGKLLSYLDAKGLWENTLVVLTSDHGEGLGQHHERTHLVLTYETTLSVPLLFAGWGVAENKVVAGCLGRLIDIMPTVLDLVGVAPPAGRTLDGVSLAPLLGMEEGSAEGPQIAYFETLGPLSFDWSYLDGVTTVTWKYIRGPEDELFHLPDDPLELDNVLEDHAQVVESLDKAADRFASVASESGGVCAMGGRQTDLFGALGYIALDVKARRPSKDAPHPKDMVSILDIFGQAHGAYATGRYDQALPFLDECIRLSPGTAMFHEFMGNSKLKLRDFGGAETALRRALEIHPEMIDARMSLALALVNLGEFEEAEEALREVIRRAPTLHKGYGYLANLLSQQNRDAELLELLEALFEHAQIPDPEEAGRMRAEMTRLRRELQSR
jgi:arylsulfatase A-like enzyme